MSKSIIRGTATFDDYKVMHPKIVASLEKKYGSPLPDEYQKYLLDTATASVMNVENLGTWMNRSVMCVDRIVSGSASYSDYSLFWICLFGIVDEYYDDLVTERIEAHGGEQQAMAHYFAVMLKKEIISLRTAVIKVMAIK